MAMGYRGLHCWTNKSGEGPRLLSTTKRIVMENGDWSQNIPYQSYICGKHGSVQLYNSRSAILDLDSRWRHAFTLKLLSLNLLDRYFEYISVNLKPYTYYERRCRCETRLRSPPYVCSLLLQELVICGRFANSHLSCWENIKQLYLWLAVACITLKVELMTRKNEQMSTVINYYLGPVQPYK